MNTKQSLDDYQYNQKLYDIISENISNKSFRLDSNKKIEFYESIVENYKITYTGSLEKNPRGKKIIKIPFCISKISLKRPFDEKGTMNFLNKRNGSRFLYLFVWMVSDNYISFHQCCENEHNGFYEPLSSDIMETYDFIKNLKTPENIINKENFFIFST